MRRNARIALRDVALTREIRCRIEVHAAFVVRGIL
jgi:hypothetical protein